MFDILNEVNNFGIIYRLKHLSKFIKSLGFIYLAMAIAAIYFLALTPSDKFEVGSLASIVFTTMIVVMCAGAWLLTIYNDNNYFYSYDKVKNMNEIEYDFICHYGLERYKHIGYVTNYLTKQFKNIDFLTSKQTVDYIAYIKTKTNEEQDNGDRWMLEHYESHLQIVTDFHKRIEAINNTPRVAETA